jgi:F-type H+-transporting ATPase subunit b
MELLTKLGIDWRILIAQLINFGVLLAVLSYFVYKPVLKLIDDRREKVKKAMETAERIEKEKLELDQVRTGRLREADSEAGKMLEAAKVEAERTRTEIITTAQREAEQMMSKAREQMERERADMIRSLQETLAGVIVQMTEKILEREFSKTDQERIIGSVSKQLPAVLK